MLTRRRSTAFRLTRRYPVVLANASTRVALISMFRKRSTLRTRHELGRARLRDTVGCSVVVGRLRDDDKRGSAHMQPAAMLDRQWRLPHAICFFLGVLGVVSLCPFITVLLLVRIVSSRLERRTLAALGRLELRGRSRTNSRTDRHTDRQNLLTCSLARSARIWIWELLGTGAA